MAATVSAWAKPGAWALDSEEQDASLLMDNKKKELLETADSTMASDFPSLSAAAAVATGKGSKKKGRKISLAEFSIGHPVSHGTAKFRPSAASFNENIDLVLPTGPRERTAEEIEWSSSSRGDRSRWGSSREDQPRRGGSEGGFGGERERDSGPSRADEVDDWGAGKKSVNVAPSRERFSGGGGGFFDSQSRADESGSWVSNKRSIPVTMPSSNGRRSSDGYRDADNWGRRDKGNEVTTGGGRTRLVLQPRSLPLEAGNASSDGSVSDAIIPLKTTKTSTNPFGDARPREEVLQTKPPPPVEEVQNTGPVKIKSSTNPFGAARPREEVLAEKGHDWKKIDEKLESDKVKETPGFKNRASGLANGSRTDDKTVSSWRKTDTTVAISTTSPLRKEKVVEKEEN
ncbi:Eukaryotic translation initiation factor 4B [Zostera marina]|uniref:Eukaryotic translation initiation factor 4B n=1 Tax=Zostera marina TaxID=29655 RepID=A0A0K9PQM7_ZOSMR|nr:Eukaryotic translation initiation factor 4B [Zostera marina]